jgi:bacterioferritin
VKGSADIIEILNELLSEELTAINQYMVHSEMCSNWGYDRLHELVEKRAIDEMKHAERLIARILFLEGTPVVSRLGAVHIGSDVEKQFARDAEAEVQAVKAYNAGIARAHEMGDSGTRELLESILEDEERHIDWLEAQLEQIGQLGQPNYLAEQIRGG